MNHNDNSLPWLGCGSEFYAEQWPEETWDAYISQMREAGIEYLRLFECAWGAMEPAQGCFDFDWADRLLDRLDAVGIHYILCTPAPGAPRWLHRLHPDAAVIGPNAGKGEYALRRDLCPSHPGYLEHTLIAVDTMGKRWGMRPGLLGWQIDNEIGHPDCFCRNCNRRFVAWVQERFGTPEALTQRCGLAMWSHQLHAWEELNIAQVAQNPSLKFLFRNWSSEKWIDYARACQKALRPHTAVPILTNMMAPWHGYDHFRMSQTLDGVGMDYYPLSAHGPYPFDEANFDFLLGYTRALGHGKPFWMMETQAGGFDRLSPPPGAIMDWSMRMVAHGANAVTYFRWDTPNFGGEEMAYGVVGPGLHKGRIFAEVKQTAQRIRRLAPLVAGTVPDKARAAIYFNYDSWWKELDRWDGVLGSPAKNQVHNYIFLLRQQFLGLTASVGAVDLCGPGADLAAYRLLVMPQLAICRPSEAERVAEWVEQGGVLLLIAPGFSHDGDGVGYPAPYPAPMILQMLTGIHHGAGGRLIPGCQLRLAAGSLSLGMVKQWAEQIEFCDPAVEILATYAGDDFYARFPGATLRRHGKGAVAFLGCMLDDYRLFYRQLLMRVGLDLCVDKPGWWVRRRVHPDGRIVVFAKNKSSERQTLSFPSPATMENGEKSLTIPFRAGELRVLWLERGRALATEKSTDEKTASVFSMPFERLMPLEHKNDESI